MTTFSSSESRPASRSVIVLSMLNNLFHYDGISFDVARYSRVRMVGTFSVEDSQFSFDLLSRQGIHLRRSIRGHPPPVAPAAELDSEPKAEARNVTPAFTSVLTGRSFKLLATCLHSHAAAQLSKFFPASTQTSFAVRFERCSRREIRS